MINQYITVALRQAHYELLENGEAAALEDWLLFSLSRQYPIPVMDFYCSGPRSRLGMLDSWN